MGREYGPSATNQKPLLQFVSWGLHRGQHVCQPCRKAGVRMSQGHHITHIIIQP